MDVIVFRPQELPIALGAIRATVRHLSRRQERYLEIRARLHGSPLRARQLRAAPPQLVAATIRDAHRRKRLVQLAIIFTTVDGKVSRDHAQRVSDLARELEVDEPGLRVLPKLAGQKALLTRLAMSRRIIGTTGRYRFFLALRPMVRASARTFPAAWLNLDRAAVRI